MKKNTRNAYLVGLFVAAAFILVVLGIILIGGGKLFTRHISAIVYFQGGVRGLSNGSPVTFRGVRVGTVESIGIQINSKTLQALIPVRLSITPGVVRWGDQTATTSHDLPDLVKRGLRARLVMMSIVTGQMSVDLDFKPYTPLEYAVANPPVPEIPAIKEHPDLFEQLAEIPIREVVNEVRDTLDSVKTNLNTITARFERVGGQAEGTLKVISRAVDHLDGDASQTLASIRGLSDDARDTIKELRPEVSSTLKSARDTMTTAQGTLVSAQGAIQNVSDMIDPNSAFRQDLDSSLHDLSITMRNVRSFSEEIERKPNVLVFGKSN